MQKDIKMNKELVKYKQEIDSNPNNFKAYFEMGKLLEKQGKQNEAVSCYIKSIDINPKYGQPYHRFFTLKLTDKERQKVIKCCENATKVARESPCLHVIYHILGELLTRQNNIELASQYYQKAMERQLIATYPRLVSNEKETTVTTRKNPSFIVIGGMKCGTTSLYSYLCQHPRIVPCLRKEIHFFSSNFDRGIDWYLSMFPRISVKSKLITGEATPCMSVEDSWDRVKQSCPEIKIIVLLRNPVNRAYSHYNHVVKRFGVKKEFEEAIQRDLDNKKNIELMFNQEQGYLDVRCTYLSKGLYYFWLKEWMNIFPKEQFCILKSEDFSQNTGDIVKQVFDFLELPNYDIKDYSKRLVGNYSSMSESLYLSLHNFFSPFNQKLENLLNTKFNWK